MEIVKGTKFDLGGCNFHSDYENYYAVYEIRGNSTTIRICQRCLDKAKQVR